MNYKNEYKAENTPGHLSRTVSRRDLKRYLKSLATITSKASKDATSYQIFSAILKIRMASFKIVFGKYKTQCYCEEATIIYLKLFKTFLIYDPERMYDLCNEWSTLLEIFTSSSRAETFVKKIQCFKCLVDHLQNAGDRWSQLIILPILRLYTKAVNYHKIKALHLPNCFEFLQVIHQIVHLPRQGNISLRSDNALLTWINSKNTSIFSFQPYKIVCNGEKYILTEYELWIDWNVSSKVISFIAISVMADKSNCLCGLASTSDLQIISHKEDLLIRSMWNLGSKSKPKICETEIQFCFSAQVHTAILESDVKNVFKIFNKTGNLSIDSRLKVNKIHAEKDFKAGNLPTYNNFKAVLEPNTNLAGKSFASFSINDINFDVLEEPLNSVQTAETTKYRVCQHIDEIVDSESDTVSKSDPETSDYFAQSSEFSEKASTNELIQQKNRKRRRDLEGEDNTTDSSETIYKNKKIFELPPKEISSVSSTSSEFSEASKGKNSSHSNVQEATVINQNSKNENDGKQIQVMDQEGKDNSTDSTDTLRESKRVGELPSKEFCLVRSVSSKASEALEEEKSPRPNVQRNTEIYQNGMNQNDGKHIQVMAEVILMAADNVIRTLARNCPNEVNNVQPLDENLESFPQISDKKIDTSTHFVQIMKTEESEDSENLQCPADVRKMFDEEVFRENWAIKRFVKAILAEPDYGSDFEENERSVIGENIAEIDDHYGSLSNP